MVSSGKVTAPTCLFTTPRYWERDIVLWVGFELVQGAKGPQAVDVVVRSRPDSEGI